MSLNSAIAIVGVWVGVGLGCFNVIDHGAVDLVTLGGIITGTICVFDVLGNKLTGK
jgi:hypothetical protein